MSLELLYASRAAQPDGIAVVHRDDRISHRELVELVELVAAGLAGRGIAPGDAVALLLPNNLEFVLCFHAVSALGAVLVPLNPQFKQEELEFCFRRCEVKAVITDDRCAGVCERISSSMDWPVDVITTRPAHPHMVTLEGLMSEHGAAPLAPRPADDVFVYQFSSGSTGRPKRVARTHANVRAEARTYATSMGITSADGVFCVVPLFHTYGMGCCLLSTAQTGATLVMLEDPNPFLLKRHRALDLLEQEQPTIFPGVPFSFRVLAEAPRDADLSSIRLCFSAGTALPRSTFDAFLDRFGIPVRQLYGCTEAGTLTANLDGDPVDTFASVGKPVSGVGVRILDDLGEPVPTGSIGELAVSSPALTAGYLDTAELTAEAFRDGEFITGDLGMVDDEGRVFLTGRKKLLIDVGGYKVDPIEVEDVVLSHPGVDEAVVVGVAGDNPGEELVKAVVVVTDNSDSREIIRFCRERLANYKVPHVVEFREEIPKSPMGKVLRKYLI
ncbi:MAG TPA: AMP-binding protein [Solirubrobacteraceae bacterium]|nr:AMP-binding protein [Solirubrobacteraceae bacterium]